MRPLRPRSKGAPVTANNAALNNELELLTKSNFEAADAHSLRVALVEMTTYLCKRLAAHDKAAAKAAAKLSSSTAIRQWPLNISFSSSNVQIAKPNSEF